MAARFATPPLENRMAAAWGLESIWEFESLRSDLNAWTSTSVSVALQRVVHGPAFGALQPADQLALASKFRNPLWALRLAAK